ncbi:MAG: hypothetical protein L6R39_004742, partial [Caloplaca ligustica]
MPDLAANIITKFKLSIDPREMYDLLHDKRPKIWDFERWCHAMSMSVEEARDEPAENPLPSALFENLLGRVLTRSARRDGGSGLPQQPSPPPISLAPTPPLASPLPVDHKDDEPAQSDANRPNPSDEEDKELKQSDTNNASPSEAMDVEPAAPVDPAQVFADKVAICFATAPSTYLEFFDIFEQLRREQNNYQGFYEDVARLFNPIAPDLLEEFKQFLPATHFFAEKVQARFPDSPDVYGKLMEILQQIGRERKDYCGVYKDVAQLLSRTAPELLEGLKQFLPAPHFFAAKVQAR